ncbi:MAG: NADP-dependent isocitrate dehydrogenase [Sphaerochaeta sp.]|nr:NADP-dependent isocitrate dehydrogenase [Sphaerochaeta sp.]
MEKITIAYIEGDGIGVEITAAMKRVVEAAVERSYGSEKGIEFVELMAGQKAYEQCGSSLPQETLSYIQEHKVAIKGPLSTPVGEGARSLNVELRQKLDLYTCLRPVEYFNGVPSPLKRPELIDMVVFRENTEDIYAGIEWDGGTREAKQVVSFLQETMGVTKIRFPESSSIGIKPVSREGSERLIRSAITYALAHKRRSVTLVHKGNIMKFTEGGFRRWGYERAEREFAAKKRGDGTWAIERDGMDDLIINDCICDAFLQNILIKSGDYDVIATLNLNGDYVSDALAAGVGGIGISPGANINWESGHAIFEATHGTAPDIAGKDMANPLSLILSAAMMLSFIGLSESDLLIRSAVERTIEEGSVTADFYHAMKREGKAATLLGTAAYANRLIELL